MLFSIKHNIMLSVERANAIAMKVLEEKLLRDGELSRMVSSEIKRNVNNASKKLGIPPQEVASFIKLMLEKMYKKNVEELDKIIAS